MRTLGQSAEMDHRRHPWILAFTSDNTTLRDGGCATVFASVVSLLNEVRTLCFSLGYSWSGGSLAAGLENLEKVRNSYT